MRFIVNMIKEITSNLIIDKKNEKPKNILNISLMAAYSAISIKNRLIMIIEIFNIFLGLSFFFIYYEVTSYFSYQN